MKSQLTHAKRFSKLEQRRIIVVASENVDGRTLLAGVIGHPDQAEPPAEVLVVAPALNSRLRHWVSDEDEARRRAAARLAAWLDRLNTAGIDARGSVGDADPLQAISDALRSFDAQQIVIATDSGGREHRLMRDLVGRARSRFPRQSVQSASKRAPDSMASDVECLQEAIRELVSERQALHERNANSNELESNRTALAGRQRQLSDALIDSHVRSADGPDSLLAAA